MASLQCEAAGVFHVVFRLKGKWFKRSLDTKAESRALSRRDEIDETLDLLKRGRLEIPEGIQPQEFVLAAR